MLVMAVLFVGPAVVLFDELRAVYPERVGHAGWSVDHAGYRLSVVDIGSVFRWELHGIRPDGETRFVISGSTGTVEDAWLWACACCLSEIEEAVTS
jgi:hypothetical protein